jgi:hypothetical protein
VKVASSRPSVVDSEVVGPATSAYANSEPSVGDGVHPVLPRDREIAEGILEELKKEELRRHVPDSHKKPSWSWTKQPKDSHSATAGNEVAETSQPASRTHNNIDANIAEVTSPELVLSTVSLSRRANELQVVSIVPAPKPAPRQLPARDDLRWT